MAQNSSLQPVFSKSFPAQNLFEISLVKDTDPNLPFYKPKYFMFLSVTPGVQGDNGQRTFDKNGKITIKADIVKVFALSNSLKAVASGADSKTSAFQIFADSSKSGYGGANVGIKMAFVSEFETQDKTTNQAKKNVTISMKQGQNKAISVFFSPSEALAVSRIMDFVGDNALKLEFADKNISIGNVQTPQAQQAPQPQQYQSQQQQQQYQYQPQPQQAPQPQQYQPQQPQQQTQPQQAPQPQPLQQAQSQQPSTPSPFGDDNPF